MMYGKYKKKLTSSLLLQLFGVLLLFSFTIYGVMTFHYESWEKFFEILYNKKGVFLLVLGLRILDWVLDYGVWRCVLSLYNIPVVSILNSILVYLTQGVGILLPVQLGRVVRGFVLTRRLNIPIDFALIVEGYMLFLVFNGALLTFLVFLGIYIGKVWIAIGMAFLILNLVWVSVKYGENFLIKWFSKIPKINDGYLSYVSLTLICGLGWIINGLIFYYLLQGGSSKVSFVETQVILLGSIFISVISGVPGGLGILELMLGVSLHWLNVDTPEMVIVVGAFRLLTIGLWIPVGWFSLALLGFRVRKIYQSIKDET